MWFSRRNRTQRDDQLFDLSRLTRHFRNLVILLINIVGLLNIHLDRDP